MKRTELVSDVRPKVGDVVTFEYDSFSRSSSSSIPIAPKISRIRTDLSWESILFEAYRSQALLNGMTCATFEQQVNIIYVSRIIDQGFQIAVGSRAIEQRQNQANYFRKVC